MAAAVAGAPRGASAQNLLAGNGQGMDTHLFRPAMDSKGLFSVNGSDILGKNDISFGLVLDYGNTLLRVPSFGQATPELIEHSFQGTLQVNYGLANHFVVGLDIPVDLMTGDPQVQANGTSPVLPNQWGTTQLNSQNLGFLAAHAKWRITRVEKGLGLALGVQVGGSPTSTPLDAGADPGFWYWPQAIVEKRFGRTGQLQDRPQRRVPRSHGERDDAQPEQRRPTSTGASSRSAAASPSASSSRSTSWARPTGPTCERAAPRRRSSLSNEAVGGIKLFVEQRTRT